MIAFFFPIVLIIICTVYAVLTRKIPEAFNESKVRVGCNICSLLVLVLLTFHWHILQHIGFTMYTTCVIWLAFVPLYFATGNHVPLRITSMSVTISLSALVCMACLFTPKVIDHWKFPCCIPITSFSSYSSTSFSYDLNATFDRAWWHKLIGAKVSSSCYQSIIIVWLFLLVDRIGKTASDRFHVNDVNCYGDGHYVQSKGENSTSHVDCWGEKLSVFR